MIPTLSNPAQPPTPLPNDQTNKKEAHLNHHQRYSAFALARLSTLTKTYSTEPHPPQHSPPQHSPATTLPQQHAMQPRTPTLHTLARTLAALRWHARECPFAPRNASSASSSRWTARAISDPFSKIAMLRELRSRAGLKLDSLDRRYTLFKPGMTVVDLGYAPGSWTQVAVQRTAPRGRVVGIDLIPAMPPRGASTIQGDFTSPLIQASIRRFLADPERGRPRKALVFRGETKEEDLKEGDLAEADRGYIERERMMSGREDGGDGGDGRDSVDVVLSDMCEPWPLIEGMWRESLRKPYLYSRLMNVSGIPLRDHAGSMNLCNSALLFCIDVLKPGGAFVCKFYQGPDDVLLEKKIKKVFERVARNKPEASRLESRECYFVAQRRRANVDKNKIMEMPSTAEDGEPFVE